MVFPFIENGYRAAMAALGTRAPEGNLDEATSTSRLEDIICLYPIK